MEFDEMDGNGTTPLRVIAERQEAMEHQLKELTQVVKALEARLSGLSTTGEQEQREIEIESISAGAEGGAEGQEGVTGEIAAVIGAAATAFLDRKARTGAAAAGQGAVSAWTQQGRVVVQTSHNFRSR